VYLGFAYDIPGLSAKAAADIGAMDTKKKAKGALRNLVNFSPAIYGIAKSAKYLTQVNVTLEEFRAKYQSGLKATTMFKSRTSSSQTSESQNEGVCRNIINHFSEGDTPYVSSILPYGKIEGSMLRSSRLRRFQYFDLSRLSPTRDAGPDSDPLGEVSRWLSTAKTKAGRADSSAPSFPLLLFSYSDVLEMSDILLSILSNRGEAVLIFVP